MGTTVSHPLQLGRNTKISTALLPSGLRTAPTDTTLTISGAVTKGATSIALAGAVGQVIPANQSLLFTDSTGAERLVKLTADAAATDTAITVAATDEVIADAATAPYPVEVFDRTSVDLSASGNIADSTTLNTGGIRDGVQTGTTKGGSAPGQYYHYNAGTETCRYAFETGREVWMVVEFPPPNDAYSKGQIVSGPALISDFPSSSPADGSITQDLSFEFVGATGGAVTPPAATP